MKLVNVLLLVFPFWAGAQTPEPFRSTARERAFLTYGDAVESVSAPNSVRESVRFVRWYQQQTAGRCSYALYLFRPGSSAQYYVKKFTIEHDTVATEAPLVALPPRQHARVERFFRQARRVIRTPYPAHFGPSHAVTSALAPLLRKQPAYWLIVAHQRPPYAPFSSRLFDAQANKSHPRDRSLPFVWRQRKAVRTLRKVLHDFTSCP